MSQTLSFQNASSLSSPPATVSQGSTRATPGELFHPHPTRWAGPALAALMLAAGVVYSLGIKAGLIHNYYGPAVYSMSQSWSAFFWGAFDGTSITMDKIPGAFWIQALSVRVFGWSDWAVLMPQVLQAVAAIGVIFAMVRRWAGDTPAFIASAALATTPIVAALAHSQIVDTQLMLLLCCAAWAWTKAVEKGSGKWLALAGVFVGLGFNAKMAQAWGVLPALAIGYLLFAPGSRGRRWAQTIVAGIVTLAASLWWVIIASPVPAANRPWIDGAADNSVWTMVFEYNLLGRYESGTNAGPGGSGGWGYLLGADVASQIGWLYPAAIIGLVYLLWARRRAPRTDLLRASTVMWGLWLATFTVAFSLGRVAHSFYTVALAPAIVALAATAAALAWQAWQRGHRLPLPLLVLPTLAWTVYLSSQFSGFASWTIPAVIALAVVGFALAFTKKSPAKGLAAAALTLSVLLTPAAWAVSTSNTAYTGQAIGPTAGPVHSMGGGQGARSDGQDGQPPTGTDGGAQGQQAPSGTRPDGGQPPAGMDGQPPTGGQAPSGPQGGTQDGTQGQDGSQGGPNSGGGTAQATSNLTYIAANDPGSTYDAVVIGYDSAGSYIEAGGRIISVGGFTGSMPNLSVSELEQLAASDQVHYIVLSGQGGQGGPGGSGNSELTSWITSNCTAVDGQTGLYRCN